MSLQPRNFHFKERTKAAKLNASLYVFTPLRDIDLRGMNITERKLQRCKLYLIESFPQYKPSYAALVDSGQLVIVEEMIPALHQINSLQESFKKEGLTAIDCDYEQALEIEAVLEAVRPMTLQKAIEYFYGNVKDKELQKVLVDAFQKAYLFAMGVLGTTRREIQNARSGRKGKSFIDRRDALFCQLTDTTELSILAPEGAAAQNTIKNLVSELTGALSPSTELSVDTVQELVSLIKKQGAEIEALKKAIADAE